MTLVFRAPPTFQSLRACCLVSVVLQLHSENFGAVFRKQFLWHKNSIVLMLLAVMSFKKFKLIFEQEEIKKYSYKFCKLQRAHFSNCFMQPNLNNVTACQIANIKKIPRCMGPFNLR